MSASENDVADRQLREVIEAMNAAKANRQRNLERACNSKDLNLARRLVALEIAAEKHLELVMSKFGAQADTWGRRAGRAGEDTPSSDIESAFNRCQMYAEAELACEKALQASETKLARLKLLELEATLASLTELQNLIHEWSDKADKSRKAEMGAYETFALSCKSICQRALDAKEKESKFDHLRQWSRQAFLWLRKRC